MKNYLSTVRVEVASLTDILAEICHRPVCIYPIEIVTEMCYL